MLGILSEMCRRAESGEVVNVQHLEIILEFLKVFVDQCHHGKEEGILFPTLESVGIRKEGGPIGQMLVEHEEGRQLVGEITRVLSLITKGEGLLESRLCESLREYIELFNQHIQKENQVLFVLADTRLSKAQQDALLGEFEKLEEEKIGVGGHEVFHRLLDELTEIYTTAVG